MYPYTQNYTKSTTIKLRYWDIWFGQLRSDSLLLDDSAKLWLSASLWLSATIWLSNILLWLSDSPHPSHGTDPYSVTDFLALLLSRFPDPSHPSHVTVQPLLQTAQAYLDRRSRSPRFSSPESLRHWDIWFGQSSLGTLKVITYERDENCENFFFIKDF